METTFVDYYEVLGVSSMASATDIAKAYKKQALKVHPDRNPDDPLANEKFQKLSKAYDILTDEKAKEAFDAVLRNKMKAKIRDGQMSDKRRQMKETLLEREKAYKDQRAEEERAERRLQAEIERIKRDAKKRKQDEIERIIEEEKQKNPTPKKMKPNESQTATYSKPSFTETWEYHEELERQTLALMAKAAAVMKQTATTSHV